MEDEERERCQWRPWDDLGRDEAGMVERWKHVLARADILTMAGLLPPPGSP